MARASGQTGQGGAAKPGIAGGRADGADPQDPFGVAAWLKNVPDAPLHPLLTHPAAAIAAATALGFGIASQAAGVMVGAMQGALETMQKTSAAADEKTDVAVKAESVAKPAPKVAERKVAKAKPVRKAVSAKAEPASTKPAVAGGADLKAISGIGPKLEQVLKEKGILSLADMAALSPARVARIDDELGLGGRIVRDDWVGQAKGLQKS